MEYIYDNTGGYKEISMTEKKNSATIKMINFLTRKIESAQKNERGRFTISLEEAERIKVLLLNKK